MKPVNLLLEHANELLKLEEEMYWRGEKWKGLWNKEAREKFKLFIEDYLKNFPQGCFGLVDTDKRLLGAMFLLKISKFKPIPYLHKITDFIEENGEIAYVSFFVVKKGNNEFDIANKLYNYAEEIALLKLKCKAICVVIYSSPVEEKALISHNYERLNRQFEWKIYPNKKVSCRIYYYDLLMKRGN